MKTGYTSRAVVVALAIIGGFFALKPCSAQADPTTQITGLKLELHTGGDDKDKGEAINIQIIKNDTDIIYDSGWIGANNKYHENDITYWPFEPKRPFKLGDSPNLKLRVEKKGDKGWQVSFRLLSNNNSIILVDNTPEVLFGKRNSVVVDKPLLGADGVKATHLDGGSIHVFAFTAKP
jgi:hypothetical protein